MNKRIKSKKIKNEINKIEKEAIKKIKARYKNVYMIKKGPRKNDIIIKGLENWKIQFDFLGEEPSIMLHPYSIIDSYTIGKTYLSMCEIDDELFELLDDIIKNEKYHIGCAWAGKSETQEEGMKKYDEYLTAYNEHMNETKEIKSYMENYLKELAQNELVKEVIVYHSKGNLYEESYGVFVFAKHNITEEECDSLTMQIKNAFKTKKNKSSNELKSKILLPGRGIRYKFKGVFIGKDEREYRKRLGKDIYKSFTKM